MQGAMLLTFLALVSLISAEESRNRDKFNGIICSSDKDFVNVTVDFDAKSATVVVYGGVKKVYTNIMGYWDGHASGLVNAGNSFSLYYRNNFGFYRDVRAFVLTRFSPPLLSYVEFGNCGHS
jgi:hypothetical protein